MRKQGLLHVHTKFDHIGNHFGFQTYRGENNNSFFIADKNSNLPHHLCRKFNAAYRSNLNILNLKTLMVEKCAGPDPGRGGQNHEWV